MRRLLLPLAMLTSLVPPTGLIAWGAASANTGSGDVQVTVPSTTPSASPTTTTVHISSGGKTYSCPAGENGKLHPLEQRAGELQVRIDTTRSQLKRITARLKTIDAAYPGHTAPAQIADEYNGLLRKGRALETSESQLVQQFNGIVDQHNSLLKFDCS
jgi:hypothetical protein